MLFVDKSTEPAREMQLYIIPYRGTQISSAQIAKDTRGQAVGTPAEVVLGSGIRGLVFETDDTVFGRLREVWFILNGHLIEVTTNMENDQWLAEVMATLKPNTL